MKKLLLALLLVPVAGLAGRTPQSTPPPEIGIWSDTGIVVSSSDVASDAAAEILARGGNAVDAAVATAFAMAVTYPFAGNIGGGGFMIVRTPDGNATTFDYREKAPGKSTPTMYLNAQGQIDGSLTRAGYLAPGVPGTVRGMALAHKRFGKLSWNDVVQPAVKLAYDGFVMSASLASSLNSEVRGRDGTGGPMKPFPASVAAYGKPGGAAWAAGDRIVQTDLGKSLSAIANDGPDAFYTGWIADRIAEDMARNGGLISKADLAAYQAKERAPIKGSFLGYEIISMPPPSSGGVALVEALNMLEAVEIQKKTRGSVEAWHLITEAQRRAFLDRARYLGDPDFSDIPVARLISKPHAQALAKTIDPKQAAKSVELGRDIVTVPQGGEPEETTHFSVIDRNGMAVSNTYTLEGGYGSHVVIAGTGILLNNEMGDFNKKPGTTDLTGNIGTQPNLIAPGKRMLSSMTPTMVTRDGKLVLVTGSPGGRTIINTVLNVVLNVTAWGMQGRPAVTAPRSHHQWLPDNVTIEDATPQLLAGLKALGHDARTTMRQGSAQTIWIDSKGTVYGVEDRRDATAKASKPSR
jgi:gamma-glutamyltranspeptidase/glutathione hydrolase